jgi:hypothetical protein
LHINTLHEIHKFDESLIVANSAGDKRINIESDMTETKYKENFKPVEKHISRSPSTVSILYDIYMTGKANECKEAIFSIPQEKPHLHLLQPQAWTGTLYGHQSIVWT